MEFPKGYVDVRAQLIPNFDDFMASYSNEPIRSFFVNENKISTKDFIKQNVWNISKEGRGWRLLEDIKVGKTPEHHAGMIYMQELSAMMPVNFLPLKSTDWVLDLCSAPGGKAIQVANRVPDGFVVANEVVKSRANILKSNIERMGLSNICIINNEPKSLEQCVQGLFDAVVVDAPCSGEGMFRKDENARLNWSQANVEACAVRQLAILETANKMLKNTGYLLYSTCTFSLEENEQVIAQFCAKHNYKIMPLKHKNAVAGEKIGNMTTDNCLRFYPHKFKGEGQFVALLQKCEECRTYLADARKLKPLNKYPSEYKIVKDFCQQYVVQYDDILSKCIYNGGTIYYAKHIGVAESGVNLINCGVVLGEIIKNRFEPHHNFATAFGKRFKQMIELSEQDAYKYLRGETLPIVSSGFVVLTYKGVVLGLGKGGDCVKNHYPKGIRNM